MMHTHATSSLVVLSELDSAQFVALAPLNVLPMKGSYDALYLPMTPEFCQRNSERGRYIIVQIEDFRTPSVLHLEVHNSAENIGDFARVEHTCPSLHDCRAATLSGQINRLPVNLWPAGLLQLRGGEGMLDDGEESNADQQDQQGLWEFPVDQQSGMRKTTRKRPPSNELENEIVLEKDSAKDVAGGSESSEEILDEEEWDRREEELARKTTIEDFRKVNIPKETVEVPRTRNVSWDEDFAFDKEDTRPMDEKRDIFNAWVDKQPPVLPPPAPAASDSAWHPIDLGRHLHPRPLLQFPVAHSGFSWLRLVCAGGRRATRPDVSTVGRKHRQRPGRAGRRGCREGGRGTSRGSSSQQRVGADFTSGRASEPTGQVGLSLLSLSSILLLLLLLLLIIADSTPPLS
eukprot:1462143-Rhodomonas_salina.1